MTEEQILKGRLSDLAKRAYNQNIYTYSNFLSLAEQSILEELRAEISYIHIELNGGGELCERQMAGFGSEEEFGYPGEFPIKVVMVSPLLEKFSDDLSHRDFLGALMHLGIERDTLGDIIVKEKTAFIYCLPQIAEYICKELTKVKHTNVKCKIVETDIPALKPATIEETFPVASLRLDVILSALLKCSRKEALALFENKQVTLNGHVTGRNSISLNNGDIFSVRGHGKFIFDHAGGNTRKGKVYVHIQRYV